MEHIKITGIKRGTRFSPNHTGNDNAIFELTAARLRDKGCDVTVYAEDEFCEKRPACDMIFGMARDRRTVAMLQQYELAGTAVINSGFGIEKCFRANMTVELLNNDVPYPESFLVSTEQNADDVFKELKGSIYWIKRGDFHAMHKEDVVYVSGIDEGNMILKEFAARGIPEAVISEHLPGDLVKFYGVRGTSFFHWFYPVDVQHSKFGYEAINGASKNIPFSVRELEKTGTKAAEILNVYIYGGDAIIAADGTIRIIDLNDWPSFAPCREEAAPHIADIIYELIKTRTSFDDHA